MKNCEIVENFVTISEMSQYLNLKKVQSYRKRKREERMSQKESNKPKMSEAERKRVYRQRKKAEAAERREPQPSTSTAPVEPMAIAEKNEVEQIRAQRQDSQEDED